MNSRCVVWEIDVDISSKVSVLHLKGRRTLIVVYNLTNGQACLGRIYGVYTLRKLLSASRALYFQHRSCESSVSTWTFFFEIKPAWVMVVCSNDVGWGRGVVTVIATGPRFSFAHQQMLLALLDAGWPEIWTVAKGTRAGDTGNTLREPLLRDTKPFTCRNTVFSPALSADEPGEAC